MKNRNCDKCKAKITGEYIKCSKAQMVNGTQKLLHEGDLCLNCWRQIIIDGI